MSRESAASAPPEFHGDDVALALGSDARDDRLRRAWEALLPHSDRIAETINASLRRSNPQWWDTVDPALAAEVDHSTREHVRRGLQALSGHGDPDRRTTDVWRETGRRRARQGVPLELTLNAYTLGARVLWEALLHLDQPALDDHLRLAAGQRLWHDLHVQNSVLIDAHRRESARLDRRDQHRQQGVLDRLAEGSGTEPGFIDEAAATFDISAGEPVACVVAPIDDSLEEPLRGVDDKLERAGIASFWHVRGGTHFGLIPLGRSSADDLVKLLRPGAASRVGIGVAAEGLAGFTTAFQLASRAAQTLPRDANDVVLVTDRLPELLIGASPDVVALLVEESVGPLVAHHQSEVMLTTLAALIRCSVSPTRAAAELYCHRNTVLYRLRQIEQLTGRDLNDARDRLLLALGLVAIGRSPDAATA